MIKIQNAAASGSDTHIERDTNLSQYKDVDWDAHPQWRQDWGDIDLVSLHRLLDFFAYTEQSTDSTVNTFLASTRAEIVVNRKDSTPPTQSTLRLLNTNQRS